MPLIIFDCDGVLVDSEVVFIATELEFLSSIGLMLDKDEYVREFMGMAPEEWEHRVRKLAGSSPDDDPDLFVRLNQLTHSRLESDLLAIDGARYCIEKISGEVCVASSSEPNDLEWKLQHTNLIDLFRPNLFSTRLVRKGKPAPDPFLLVAQRMGFPHTDCIVVEDSSNGVIAAKNAGVKAVGFTAGCHCVTGHDVILRSDGADAIARDYQELSDILKQI